MLVKQNNWIWSWVKRTSFLAYSSNLTYKWFLEVHAMSVFVWRCALNGRSRRLVRYFPAPIFCKHKYGSSRTHLHIKLGTNLHIDFWNSEKPGRDIICSTPCENLNVNLNVNIFLFTWRNSPILNKLFKCQNFFTFMNSITSMLSWFEHQKML